MIRVNLVDAGRHVEKRRILALPEGQQLALAGTVLLIVTASIVGWRYWTLAQTAAALDVEIAAAQEQEAQLAEVLRQVQSFETRRVQLEQRVALIDELRRGQAVPVHVIDQVSRALPEGMWLTRLTQSGVEITIEGDCLSLMALSDFVGNLEGSQYFTRPVEIINSEVVPARDSLPEVIHFSVKGTFRMGAVGSREAGTEAGSRPAFAQEESGELRRGRAEGGVDFSGGRESGVGSREATPPGANDTASRPEAARPEVAQGDTGRG